MHIDPSAITLIQTTFLQHIAAAFATVATYALNLLYLFAALELVLFGIGWALQQDAIWGKLFFKLLKIGLILIVIQNYPDIINTIINSFGTIAGVVINKVKVGGIIFNPVNIWQYGYDSGILMLKSATEVNSLSLVLILISLGIGILLVFGLLGIQVVLQMVSFYLVAIIGLIMLPFGVFEPSRRMFDRVVQTILQASVRVMTVMIIVGVAAIVWDGFTLTEMSSKVVSLNQSLGLFFSALLFLLLAIHLPKLAATAIGEIGEASNFTGSGSGEPMSYPITPFAASATSEIGSDLSAMQAAAAIDNTGLSSQWQPATAIQSNMAESSGGVGSTQVNPFGLGDKTKSDSVANSWLGGNDQMRGTTSASTLSVQTLKKLQEVLAKIPVA